jgi:hypothetical protein
MRSTQGPLPGRIAEGLVQLAALGLAILLGLRALLRVDQSWDTWMYHLPFAARLWGIVPADAYVLPGYLEDRYQGVPLLGEWVQGLLWWLTGHPEATSLPGLASLFLFVWFLKRQLQIPPYLGLVGLAAIPLVLIHATTAYVDLPSNLAFAVLVLMTYLMYVRPGFPTRGHLLLMVLAAALAANIKFQLVPLLPLVLVFVAGRLLWLARGRVGATLTAAGGALRLAVVTGLALAVMFAVPLKNLVLHGNPVYPIEMHVLGVTLPGPEVLPSAKEMPSLHFVPTYLEHAPGPQRWLYSLLEVGLRPLSDPKRWTVDQFMPHGSSGTMMGGYSVAYVVFNLLLLVYLVWRLRSPEARGAAAVMLATSGVVALVPQSHELRYTLFWMVVLVSLNLYLLGQLGATGAARYVNRRSVGLAMLAALALTVAVTRGQYIDPTPYPVSRLVDVKVDRAIMAKVGEGDRVCFSHEPWTFLYTSYFHPPLRYSLKERDCSGGYRSLGLAKFGPD